jgi:hypothetical protein
MVTLRHVVQHVSGRLDPRFYICPCWRHSEAGLSLLELCEGLDWRYVDLSGMKIQVELTRERFDGIFRSSDSEPEPASAVRTSDQRHEVSIECQACLAEWLTCSVSVPSLNRVNEYSHNHDEVLLGGHVNPPSETNLPGQNNSNDLAASTYQSHSAGHCQRQSCS